MRLTPQANYHQSKNRPLRSDQSNQKPPFCLEPWVSSTCGRNPPSISRWVIFRNPYQSWICRCWECAMDFSNHHNHRQYFTVPHLFLQESSHSSRIPVESTGIHRNSTGIKQTKVEILYLTLHFVLIYRTTYFSLLSLLFLHLFKSVSHLQSVYSSTLPLGYNFK